MQPPERALRVLRDAYGAGHLSTATLESRAEWILGGRVDDALWDLHCLGQGPHHRFARRWWRPAPAVRSLVAEGLEWSLGDKGRWVIGRGADADFVLPEDDAVSRTHAEIAVRAGLCLIRDLDSCNGTLLNGRPVRRGGRARLHRGDVLLLGETEVRVR